VIGARGIAGAVSLQPLEYIGIQAHRHQLLGWAPELGELLLRERRNIGIVDLTTVRPLLPPPNALERRLLAFSKKLVLDRFGAHAALLPGPG
jgi:hypothetical protein